MNRDALSLHLKQDTEAICYPYGRMVGTLGHTEARQHLKNRLMDLGCLPFAQNSLELPYTWGGMDFCNLVGCIPGRQRGLPPVLIGAHYDSVIAAPCADDNAAAVAIALQAGRLISNAGGLERDVLIAIFDAEEPPHFRGETMGSERFFREHLSGPNDIHAAIIMDLVGHDVSVPMNLLSQVPGVGGLLKMLPGAAQADIALPVFASALFVTGSESHVELPDLLQRNSKPKGLKIIATRNDYIGDVSDHGVFRRHGVPYYFLSCGQWQHYHQPTDTPDRLNYGKMAHITRYVVDLLTHLTEAELAARTGREHDADTLALEAELLHQAMGLFQSPILAALGIKDLKSRDRMDEFVNFLINSGLRC